jgi:4-phytase/acid phosphatase
MLRVRAPFRRLGMLAAVLSALAGASAPSAAAPALRLERVVLLMRHGVRPPTKLPAMPAGIAADPWPVWSSKPGYLTAHGAAAIRLLGKADRVTLAKSGLMPAQGCPRPGLIEVVSDSDQRTIATGNAWIEGVAPGCRIAHRHKPQDVPDPLFLNAGENGEPFDPARADASVAEVLGQGGIAAAHAGELPLLVRLDRILCGDATTGCGLAERPSGLERATADKRPKLKGALDLASTAAQILLLEYAEGFAPKDIGWGRATPADVTALGVFHAEEFAILARPLYLATVNVAPLARRMMAALSDRAPHAPRIVALMGHDTNVASLGGLLGLHWQAPGFAADDPPPGGAIVLEQLRDGAGARFVRARFRASGLDQIRSLAAGAPYGAILAIDGCGTLCPLDRFQALVEGRLKAAR